MTRSHTTKGITNIVVAIALLLALAPLAAAQSKPAGSKGSIAGVVRRAGTGEPVDGAKVTLSSDDDAERFIRTDSAGRFFFADVAGDAYLNVKRPGYVTQDPVCLKPEPECDDTIAAGTIADGITIDLVPKGAIDGVVREIGGNPLPLVWVRLLENSYDTLGARTVRMTAAVRTDDRGEYRLHYVTPGRYYLEAGTPPEGVNDDGRSPYIRQYYPSKDSLEEAILVNVAPGADLRGFDLALKRGALFHARGHVVDTLTGKPPAGIRIVIAPAGLGAHPFEATRLVYDAADGAFDIPDLLAGRYTLVVTQRERVANFAPAAAYATVIVTDQDIADLPIALARGGTLTGRLILEGKTNSAGMPLRLPDIELQPVLNGAAVSLSNMLQVRASVSAAVRNSESPTYDADGSFRFPNLRPGVYRFTVRTYLSYVKEARMDGAVVTEEDITIAGDTGPLTIVVGSDVARITGVVSADGGGPARGAAVVFVPDQTGPHPNPARLLFTAAESDGAFEVPLVPPGDYRAFAFVMKNRNGGDYRAFFNPEFRARYAAFGVPVHVTAGSNPALVLRVIPAVQPGGAP